MRWKIECRIGRTTTQFSTACRDFALIPLTFGCFHHHPPPAHGYRRDRPRCGRDFSRNASKQYIRAISPPKHSMTRSIKILRDMIIPFSSCSFTNMIEESASLIHHLLRPDWVVDTHYCSYRPHATCTNMQTDVVTESDVVTGPILGLSPGKVSNAAFFSPLTGLTSRFMANWKVAVCSQHWPLLPQL